MNKLIAALLALGMSAAPAFASFNTNGPEDSQEYVFRSATHFMKHLSMSMGVGQLNSSNGSGGYPQQMDGIGLVFQLSAPVASSTAGAVTAGQTLPAYTILPISSTSTAGEGKVLKAVIDGTTAANANTKTIQFIWGTQTITLLSAASNAKDFHYEVTIYSTGYNTQEIVISGYANGALINQLSTTGTQNTQTQLNVGVSLSTATANSDAVVNELVIYGDS